MVKLPSKYSDIKRELAAYARKDEVKEIINKAHAMEVYAFQANDGELAEYTVEIRNRAERRLGQLMQSEPKAKGTRGQISGKRAGTSKGKGKARPVISGGVKNTPPEIKEKALKDQGIDKNLAKRARRAANLSEEEHEAKVAEAKELAKATAEGNQAVLRVAKNKRHERKTKSRKEKEAKLAKKLIADPEKKYAVILADPEWKFQFYSERGMMNSAPENHYPTSPLEVIKKRDVASIAAADCVLFLWATMPMLPQALEVMEAWGFEYKTGMCWDKGKAGTGYWFRNQHELLLLGTRGKIPAPSEGMQASSIITALARKHSQKPQEAYLIIEKYFPTVPKIELNARAKRSGWDAWGNEVL
jgi:N6-adenosine-specific RNA methylase IME4